MKKKIEATKLLLIIIHFNKFNKCIYGKKIYAKIYNASAESVYEFNNLIYL